ncbi:hypothetical protein Q1695_011127 [Nippostrongylus brasiliensis]|nr:hypothetical protein Q1695_011127 [Nippostrongylus brasiliensis]
MAILHRIIVSTVVIGIAAFFYDVQGAPTETALRPLNSDTLSSSENSTDLLAADGSTRVKRQGGGCGCCGCGCCGCGGGGGGGCGCCCCRPRCCCTCCRTCCCTRCCTCCRPCCCGCGCGCCGCGGGGRKRRSLDNLRIRLNVHKSAEQKGEQVDAAEYPRTKRSAFCDPAACAMPGAAGHVGLGHSHEGYADY